MRTKNAASPEQNSMARQIWLNYYNDYLRDHGTITEESWRRMRLAIGQSQPAQPKARRSQAGTDAPEQKQEQEHVTMTMC